MGVGVEPSPVPGIRRLCRREKAVVVAPCPGRGAQSAQYVPPVHSTLDHAVHVLQPPPGQALHSLTLLLADKMSRPIKVGTRQSRKR
jgi:hypothetical protein